MFADYEKYAKLRDERGLTDYKVAAETKIPKSTFSDWKSGRSKPKADKIIKISSLFGVPIEALMSDTAAVEG